MRKSLELAFTFMLIMTKKNKGSIGRKWRISRSLNLSKHIKKVILESEKERTIQDAFPYTIMIQRWWLKLKLCGDHFGIIWWGRSLVAKCSTPNRTTGVRFPPPLQSRTSSISQIFVWWNLSRSIISCEKFVNWRYGFRSFCWSHSLVLLQQLRWWLSIWGASIRLSKKLLIV